MKRITKSILTWVLTLAMLLPQILIPLPAHAAAPGEVAYDGRKLLELPLMNKKMTESIGFYNAYVKTDGWFNIVGYFASGWGFSMKEQTRLQAQYSYTLPDVVNQLRLDGQLSSSFRISLTNDSHKNFWNHALTSYTTAPVATLYQENAGIIFRHVDLSDGDKKISLGDGDFKDISSANYSASNQLLLHFDFYSCGYSCGSAKVSQPAVALADTVEPKIVDIYASTSSDPTDTAAKTTSFTNVGDTVYFHVKFSEYIRFSDNSPNHDDLKLAVNLASVNSNQSSGSVSANLIALQDKYLTFRYTVPAAINSQTTNHYVTGYGNITDGNEKNCLNGGEGAFTLTTSTAFQPISDTTIMAAYGLNVSRSLITDLVGNPVASKVSDTQSASGIFTPSARVYLDTVAPVISKIDMDVYNADGKLISDATENGDTVWSHVGPGCSIVLKATFSEEMTGYTTALNLNATLNITVNGTAVTVRGKTQSKKTIPNSPPDRTMIEFEPITITASHVTDNEQIKITSLYTPFTGLTITDLRGNAFSSTAAIPAPVKKFYVDTAAPLVTTGLTPSGGVYTPDTNVSDTGIIFPFTPVDNTANPSTASGVLGVGDITLMGAFKLDATGGPQSFSYYISVGSASIPPDARMSSGVTGSSYAFSQISGSSAMYLHITFPEDSAALSGAALTFTAADNAGNTGSTSFPLDDSVIGVVTDRVGPGFTLTGESFDPNAKTATLTVEASDISKVDVTKIWYAFSKTDMEPSAVPSANWTQWQESATTAQTVTMSFSTESGFLGDGDNTFYLYVKAQDMSSKQNVSYKKIAVSKNLALPSYNLNRTEPGVPSGTPLLNIANLSTPADSTYTNPGALVMISDSADFSYSWICEIKSTGLSNILGSSVAWYGSNYEEGDPYTISSSSGSVVEADSGSLPYLIRNKGYYGKLYVKVFVGYSLSNEEDKNESFTFDANYYETFELTFMCAGNGGDPVHEAKIIEDVLTEASIDDWTPDTSPQNTLPTLNGKSFTVNISNLIKAEWGLDDLDLSSSSIKVHRTINGLDGVYDSNLDNIEGSVFRFTINAADEDYCNIQWAYEVVVSLVSKGTGKTDVYNYVIEPEVSPWTPAAGIYNMKSVTYHHVTSSYARSLRTDTTTFGKYDTTSEEMVYTAPTDTVILGTYSDSYISRSHSVTFASDNYYVEGSGGANKNSKVFVRAWNATTSDLEASGKPAATWGTMAGASSPNTTTFLYDIVSDVSDAEASYAKTDEIYIPVIEGMTNIIAYEFVYENGIRSGIKTFIVETDSEAPAFDLLIDEPEDGVPVPSAVVTVSIEPQDAIDATAYYYYEYLEGGATMYTSTELPDKTHIITENGEYWYYVRDAAGNVRLKSISIDFIDSSAPVIASYEPKLINGGLTGDVLWTDETTDGNMFALEFDVTDTDADNGFTMFFDYNDEYAARLGLDDEIEFYVSPEMLSSYYEWVAEAPVTHGIFRIVIQGSSGAYKITLYGVHKYDETEAEGDTEVVTFKFGVRDRAGNRADKDVSMTLNNIAPSIKSVGVNGETLWSEETLGDDSKRTQVYSAYAAFTTPVADVTPFGEYPYYGLSSFHGSLLTLSASNLQENYRYKKLGIYRDGTYEVSYTDVFGTVYTQKVTFASDAFDAKGTEDAYNFGLDVTFSDPDPVTGKVTAVINAVDRAWRELPNNEIQGFDVWQGSLYDTYGKLGNKDEMIYSEENKLAHAVYSATVECDPDEDIIIGLRAVSYYIWYQVVVISGYNKTQPRVEAKWYYEETASDQPPEGGETNANVRVFLSSDRGLTGINGKDISYTFTYGGPTSYTFEYTDVTGYTGSLTVDLPVSIVLPTPKPEDTAPPEYTMTIYGKISAKMEGFGFYSNAYLNDGPTTPQEAIAALPWTRGYLLNFDLTDESPARLFVRESGSGDTPDFAASQNAAITGVTVSGLQITVNDEDAEFEVVLIDAQSNYTVIDFDGSLWKIDLEAPTADVEMIQTNFNEITAYVLLDDNAATQDEMSLLYPPGLTRDTNEKYVIEFTENNGIELRFTDGVGNVGTERIDVDSIDDSVPVITSLTWAPYFVSAGGTGDVTKPPEHRVNTDVKAIIKFNTPMKEVLAEYVYDPANTGDYITLTPGTDGVVVTFKQAAEIKLDFTARNGRSGSTTITLGDVIDRDPPTATVVVTGDTSVSAAATVTITPDENVYVGGGGSAVYTQAKPFTATITTRGVYTWQLIDLAGNIATVTAEIKNIDDAPPVILLNGLPDPDIWVKGPLTFRATMSEEGTITFGGVDYPVNAPVDTNGNGKFDPNDTECDFVTLTVSKNGNYSIVGRDLANRATTTYLSVSCIDSTPPKLTFITTTVSVIQNSDSATVEDLLSDPAGWTVSDNACAAEKITVTMTNYDAAWLNTPGSYTVQYEATDAAGNTAQFSRLLKVRSLKEVVVKLNGVMTYSEEMAILDSANITLDISLPDGVQEPYKVYLRPGRWTVAQLKTRSDFITGNTFSVNKNTVYTLCIITQSRGTYLTYLYVQ